jgi:hypothetical protein
MKNAIGRLPHSDRNRRTGAQGDSAVIQTILRKNQD